MMAILVNETELKLYTLVQSNQNLVQLSVLEVLIQKKLEK